MNGNRKPTAKGWNGNMNAKETKVSEATKVSHPVREPPAPNGASLGLTASKCRPVAGSERARAETSGAHRWAMSTSGLSPFSPSPSRSLGGWAGVSRTQQGRAARVQRWLGELKESAQADSKERVSVPAHVAASRHLALEALNFERDTQRKRHITSRMAEAAEWDLVKAARDADEAAKESSDDRLSGIEERTRLPHLMGGGDLALERATREAAEVGINVAMPEAQFQRMGFEHWSDVDGVTAVPDNLVANNGRRPVVRGRAVVNVRCGVPWCGLKCQVMVGWDVKKMLGAIGRDCGESAEACGGPAGCNDREHGHWSAYYEAIDELIPKAERLCDTCWKALKGVPSPPHPL